MGLGQSLRKLAERARGKVSPEQAERGVDKAGDAVDKATGGKHASQVDKAQEKGREAARKHLRRER